MFEEDMAPPNQHTKAEIDAAYGAGYNACHDNKSITSNPYPTGSILAQEWEHGWKHYDADYNPDYYASFYYL